MINFITQELDNVSVVLSAESADYLKALGVQPHDEWIVTDPKNYKSYSINVQCNYFSASIYYGCTLKEYKEKVHKILKGKGIENTPRTRAYVEKLGYRKYNSHTDNYESFICSDEYYSRDDRIDITEKELLGENMFKVKDLPYQFSKDNDRLIVNYNGESMNLPKEQLDWLRDLCKSRTNKGHTIKVSHIDFGCQTLSIEDVQAILEAFDKPEGLDYDELEIGRHYEIIYSHQAMCIGDKFIKLPPQGNTYGMGMGKNNYYCVKNWVNQARFKEIE